MTDLLRDTVFGHLLRYLTKGRVLQYMEEKDPTLWKQYIDREQTYNMAIYGHPELAPNEQKEKDGQLQTPAEPPNGISTPSDESASTLATEKTQPGDDNGHQMHTALTNQRVDTEKGRDATMVSWWGDDDPEVWTLLQYRISGAKSTGVVYESHLVSTDT